MPINGCSNIGTAENWDVNVVPALDTNVPTDTFNYVFSKSGCSRAEIEKEVDKIKQIALEKGIKLEKGVELEEGSELEEEIQKICFAKNIKNIKLCACSDLTPQELESLIDTCTATVVYYDWRGRQEEIIHCTVTTDGPGGCLGIEAEYLPSDWWLVQHTITLEIKLERKVGVCPVDLGFTLDGLFYDPEATISGICGMCSCKQPSRKIML